MRIYQVVVASVMLLVGSAGNAQAQAVPQFRIDQIQAMSPIEMARSGAWTTAAYLRLPGYMTSIEDEALRNLVFDMFSNPESTVFNGKASPDALRTAPATGSPGHHHYPGGLAVHLVEVIEIAMGWKDMFEQVHGVRDIDRDLIIAQLVLHDWSKV